MAVDSCAKCRWWNDPGSRHEFTSGQCRRHGPMMPLRITISETYGNERARWPETVGGDWCGDFERLRTDATTATE